eukprot:gene5132-5779_t
MDKGKPEVVQDDFSEYMWMEDLDNFDKAMVSQFAEEDYIRSSIEMLLEEEERKETIFYDENGYEYIQDPQEQMFAENEDMNSFSSPQSSSSYGYNNSGLSNSMNSLNLSARPFVPHQPQLPTFQPQSTFSTFNNATFNNSPYNQNASGENLYHPYSNDGGHVTAVNPTSTQQGTTLTSNLNPNAKPFSWNVKAEEFVPRSTNQNQSQNTL